MALAKSGLGYFLSDTFIVVDYGEDRLSAQYKTTNNITVLFKA